VVEDEVDELLSLPLLESCPVSRFSLCIFLLGTAVASAVVFEELDAKLDGGVKYGLKLGQFGCLIDEGGICCRILRAVFLDLIEIPSICHHNAVLSELVQLTFVNFDLLGRLFPKIFILCLHFYLSNYIRC
jgi:hypothetical protein